MVPPRSQPLAQPHRFERCSSRNCTVLRILLITSALDLMLQSPYFMHREFISILQTSLVPCERTHNKSMSTAAKSGRMSMRRCAYAFDFNSESLWVYGRACG
ncbi:hypothetical protein RB195_013097 [Necator americanus]|uniref:Uncharacterized protein n=1 Tax=Necator americanus TaxID=51031 RepID=A0ABR1DTZ3_NECAM